jgi:hypothetical protein
MRVSNSSETIGGIRLCEVDPSARPQIALADVVEEEITRPGGRRAARGILFGIVLGAGAWAAIWAVAASLLLHQG